MAVVVDTNHSQITAVVAKIPIKVEDVEEDAYTIARAVFDFTPRAEDTNAIPLECNAIVFVFDKHESGWWAGECNGRYGIFPSTYVAEEYQVKIEKRLHVPSEEMEETKEAAVDTTDTPNKVDGKDDDYDDDDSDDYEEEQVAEEQKANNIREAKNNDVVSTTPSLTDECAPTPQVSDVLQELETARGERNTLTQEIIELYRKFEAVRESIKADHSDYSVVIEQLKLDVHEERAARRVITEELQALRDDIASKTSMLPGTSVLNMLEEERSARTKLEHEVTKLISSSNQQHTFAAAATAPLSQLEGASSVAIEQLTLQLEKETAARKKLELQLEGERGARANLELQLEEEKQVRVKLEQDVSRLIAEIPDTTKLRESVEQLVHDLVAEKTAHLKLAQDIPKLLPTPPATKPVDANQDLLKHLTEQLQNEQSARIKLEHDFAQFKNTTEKALASPKDLVHGDSHSSSPPEPSRPLATIGPRPNVNVRRGLVRPPSTELSPDKQKEVQVAVQSSESAAAPAPTPTPTPTPEAPAKTFKFPLKSVGRDLSK